MRRFVSRRTAFLRIAGMGILATTVHSYGFMGFFGNKKKGPEPDAEGVVRLSLAEKAYRPLGKNGASVKVAVKGMSKPVIVTRTDDSTVVAVSSKCSHVGCEVDLPEDGILNCHCHGSKFTVDGTVIRGPAKEELREFKALLKENTVTIEIS